MRFYPQEEKWSLLGSSYSCYGSIYTLTTTPYVDGRVLIDDKFVWSLVAASVLVMVLVVGLLVLYCRKKANKRFFPRYISCFLSYLLFFSFFTIGKSLSQLLASQLIPFLMTTKLTLKISLSLSFGEKENESKLWKNEGRREGVIFLSLKRLIDCILIGFMLTLSFVMAKTKGF